MFRLLMLRSITMAARRLSIGDVYDCDAATALALVNAGDARLADPRDLVRLLEATKPANSAAWWRLALTR
jgi:hypothetical protein